ncbi:NitT/TauT family transport system permease protein [Hydrogenispora ethanolica]|uniref:NitT/TauT family transport system permease protein n=1 Tax=Hydrogenispora ethanolica TaxID=1082276 RepID=A0A4R1S7D2_HYDET|nr:ABC transporter permease [Hydrogenispora ethanolica]TCL75238.1 NitT/TauT family transport system permease protein [Hydrogenispora ethanolica]
MRLRCEEGSGGPWRRWLRRGAVSEFHGCYLETVRRQELLIRFYQCLLLVALVAFWEIGANFKWINAFITSQPSKIGAMIAQLQATGKLWPHIVTTVGETTLGFILGTLSGTIIAVLLWWSRTIAEVLDPYIVVLNSIPKVALGPIFIVWLGAGTPAIIAMALGISVIVTIMMVFNGFNEVHPDKIRLLKSFGASRGQILRKVTLPASVPTIIAALKVNLGLSLVGTIVGEFLVSKEGLGYLIVYGGQVFNMSLVMASVIILCVVAVVMYYAVSLLEKKFVRWKGNS